MVHTLSGIVLHCLYRMCRTGDTPWQASRVVGQMVERVKEVDRQFFERVGGDPLGEGKIPESGLPTARFDGAAAAEFDRLLGGPVSRLLDYSPQAERVVG